MQEDLGQKLQELYWEKGLSQREIGTILGYSQMHIRRLMKKFGIKARDYTENKMPVKKGSHLSEAHKKAISRAHIGSKGTQIKENHWNWKGGITSINHSIRESTEYKEWRRQVFERDGYKCQMINCLMLKAGDRIEAQHIKKFSEYPELRLVVSNGITLHKRCHKAVTGRYEKFFEAYFEQRVKDLTSSL